MTYIQKLFKIRLLRFIKDNKTTRQQDNKTTRQQDGKTTRQQGIRLQTISSNTDISMATRFKIEGSKIFRNSDLVWQKEVEKSNGNRKQKISLKFTDTEDGFALSAKLYNEECEYITTNISIEKEIAINTEKALDNIKSKLSQWGDTEFAVEEIDVLFGQQTTDNGQGCLSLSKADIGTSTSSVTETTQRPTSSGLRVQGSEFKVKINDSLYQSVYGVIISLISSLRYVFQYVMKSL